MMRRFEMARLMLEIIRTVVLLILCGHFVASQNMNFSFPTFSSADSFILGSNVSFSAAGSSFYITPWPNGHACGKLVYKERVRVVAGGAVASFSTSFSFAITGDDNLANPNQALHGDGLTFSFTTDSGILGAWGSELCLLYNQNDGLPTNQVFAVEFDTFWSPWYSDPSNNHIGVDVNSLNSVATFNLCEGKRVNCSYLCNGGDFTAWIDYIASLQTLEVRFAPGSLVSGGMTRPKTANLTVNRLNLSTVFNEYMYVGFTGSTGRLYEVHELQAWNFQTRGMPELPATSPSPSPSPSPANYPASIPSSSSVVRPVRDIHASKGAALISGICVGFAVFLLCVAFCLCIRRRKRRLSSEEEIGGSAGKNIDHLLGLRLFTYKELKRATRNFSDSNLLGTGGYGAVYKGTLQPTGTLVAVKRIRQEGRQSEEGFVAEASSISQIRHRNLVQLQGWCQGKGNLMLVFDYMPNGSLDQWIFTGHRNQEVRHTWIEADALSLSARHRILAGVGAALTYLHDEWQQCVLHRDIKSSNVLLDAEFNAHLADFGLARLIDHKKVEKTTLMAGTLGYMAPEMPYTGKATKESDVYSFGVLVLEVVCGRRPLDMDAVVPEDVVLIDSVWRAHEAGELLRVADPKLLQDTRDVLIAGNRLQQQVRSFSQGQSQQSHVSGDLINTSRESVISLACDSPTGILPEEEIDVTDVIQAPAFINGEPTKIVMNLLQLGLLCCQPNPETRPSMRTINQVFQNRDFVTVLPPLPAFRPLGHYRMTSNGSDSKATPDVSFASEATSYPMSVVTCIHES